MEQNTDNFLAAQIDKYFKRKYSSKLAWVIDKLGKFIGLPIVLIFSLGGVLETTLNVSRFDGCVFYLFAGLYYVLFMYWLAVKLEQAHTGFLNCVEGDNIWLMGFGG